jgi:hypothetical protein
MNYIWLLLGYCTNLHKPSQMLNFPHQDMQELFQAPKHSNLYVIGKEVGVKLSLDFNSLKACSCASPQMNFSSNLVNWHKDLAN